MIILYRKRRRFITYVLSSTTTYKTTSTWVTRRPCFTAYVNIAIANPKTYLNTFQLLFIFEMDSTIRSINGLLNTTKKENRLFKEEEKKKNIITEQPEIFGS